MGLAASTRAVSSLTVKGATGTCCKLHTGRMVWIYPFGSHASELAKSRFQESVGVRQLRAAPHHSQPAVKWLLTDVQEGGNNGALLGTHCIPSRMGFKDTQSWRRHKWHKTCGSEVRCTGRHPVLLQLAHAALQTNANLSEFASKTLGSLLILTNQLLANCRLLS